MTRVVVSALAAADLSQIRSDLAREAGLGIAQKYNHLFDRLAVYPELGPARPMLKLGLRIGIVQQYVVAYCHRTGQTIVGIVRVEYGDCCITQKLVRTG